LIGVVIVVFLLGLIYVAHTVHLAATNYGTDQLVFQRDDLARQVQTVETSVLRWGTEQTVVERAQLLGLDQLSDRVRLSAR
jgi:predicted SpoU family rRNA methylase